ncbi:uncharacterized protein LOC119464795 [Dermacentor silvarum]|uniref:uncharacterized protein LOC119464795 n=1 Tax=Dermacentor silvarum TaxID=543639 RepID=UPI002100B10F|nr:uncharacterized protein LOC119464795 [Dermacentor silvarum]
MKCLIRTVILLGGLTAFLLRSAADNTTAPNGNSCGDEYYGEGYTTTCNYTCGNQTITYRNGTPCALVFTKPNRTVAGLCLNGTCVSSYDLTAEQEKDAHPQTHLKCPKKHHFGKANKCPTVLFEGF